MTYREEQILWCIVTGSLAGILVVVVAVFLQGCHLLHGGGDPAAAVYGAERMRCVTEADAAAEARACFARVDARWAGVRDGGAP